MAWAHVRALTPSGEREEAWRCDNRECASLTFAEPQRPCTHPRLRTPQPPKARA
jgi:hypothetical protein